MKARAELLALALLLAACSGSETEGAAPADAPAAAGDGLDVEGDVLTPDEAAAAAEASITPDNADAELEKLKREIEGG